MIILMAFGQAKAQQQGHRPPAVPLVVNDPYFSIWSMADHLTDAPTKHWAEAANLLPASHALMDASSAGWAPLRAA